jgi:hypothetical protein
LKPQEVSIRIKMRGKTAIVNKNSYFRAFSASLKEENCEALDV